ncbi:MAG TPA: HEAT repeat domain-containing protein [Nitrolancea sp.]|nr:HEAT repeat domain-containing protein [Nitrolancea sp.]
MAVVKLSDLDRATAQVAATLWTQIPIDVRRFAAHQMLEQAEGNIDLNFSRMFFLELDDPDSEIRSVAIQGLWEDESTAFLERLLGMLKTEREPTVREAVAEALGAFSLRAFEEELDPKWSGVIRPALLDLYRSHESIGVRKKALISLAYFCGDDDVEAAIQDAFNSPYHDLNTAALYAMGLNLNDRWFEDLLRSMIDEDPEIRFEAVRAIGRYGDERALMQVLDRLEDEDLEVQLSAIEALGEIGGRTAKATLQRLARSEDVVISEAADDALQDVTLNEPPRINP